jgi:hypothetical protein
VRDGVHFFRIRFVHDGHKSRTNARNSDPGGDELNQQNLRERHGAVELRGTAFGIFNLVSVALIYRASSRAPCGVPLVDRPRF